MKTSTPEQPKPPEPKSILLIGPPGGAKTTLAMGFPEVLFLDCDRNLDGPELFMRKHQPTLTYGYQAISYDDNNKPVDLKECYDKLMVSLIEARSSAYKTVVLDSLSVVNEFIVRKVLALQGKTEVTIAEWMKIKSAYIEILVAKARSLGRTFIATCHEDPVEEAHPTNPMLKIITGYEPIIQGGTKSQIGSFFTDFWRCYSEPAPGDKVEFKIQTMATSKSRYLKNSFGMDSLITVKQNELAFGKIEKWVKGKL